VLNSILKETLDTILDTIDIQNAKIYYSLKIFSKTLIIILTFFLIKKYNYSIINKNKIPITIISIILIYLSLDTLQSEIKTTINFNTNLLFLMYCLAVAFFEELFFRVFIFNYLKEIGYKYFKLIIISSLIFGFAHFINFFNDDYQKYSVINQIVFAFGIGVLLQSIYVKFRSITICIMIHALINYYGSYKSRLVNYNNSIESINLESVYSFNDFISTFLSLILILFIIVLPISYLLRKNVA
jgi:membrane protease YdiL (CAAX protease family)